MEGGCGVLEVEFDGMCKENKLANKSVRNRNQKVCVARWVGVWE